MAKLKERGWPLVAADLGDLIQFKSGLKDQALLKYATSMQRWKSSITGNRRGRRRFGVAIDRWHGEFHSPKTDRLPAHSSALP